MHIISIYNIHITVVIFMHPLRHGCLTVAMSKDRSGSGGEIGHIPYLFDHSVGVIGKMLCIYVSCMYVCMIMYVCMYIYI